MRERLEYMTEFLTEERKEVLSRTLNQRTHYMRIMTENMFHPQNASAIMRHCEAFGIQQIHTVEDRCKFDPSVNIVRGTQKWVDVEHHDTTAEALAALKAEGYRIVATTPHRCSSTPETFDVTKGKFALVFGTEHAGISEEVIEAAKLAGAHEFIMALPQGYDTPLTRIFEDDGIELSGGQWQKLAIARAFYRDSEIMILDEPTAALDPIAENELYLKYSKAARNRTSVFISHRLSSTRFCDRIILLEDARIREEGTHDELMKQKGRYAELFEIQSKYYKDENSKREVEESDKA